MADQEFKDETRKKLLNSLEQTVGLTVPPSTWAFLWLADVSELQQWVQQSRSEKMPVATRQLFVGFEDFNRVISKWMQKDRKGSRASTPMSATPRSTSQPSTPTSQAPGPRLGSLKRKQGLVLNTEGSQKYRSPQAVALCQARDQGRCIITKDFEHDVAHIYPFSLRSQSLLSGSSEDSIWTALQFFWSKDRVEAWYNAIFPDGQFIDVCHNLMCLSPSAHRYHGKGYFALKPIAISDDEKSLTVQFFWLQKGPRQKFVNMCDVPALASYDQGPRCARLINHETTELIRSGDEIRIETEDPKNYPLPNWHLLEMQWFLNRVVAISGAADVEDDYDDEDDNELMQENDFRMVSDFESEHEQQSPPADSPPSTSPPSSFSGPSSYRQKRTVTSQPDVSKTFSTDVTQSTLHVERDIDEERGKP